MPVTLIQRIPNFITTSKAPDVYELNSYEEFLDTALVKGWVQGHKDPCTVQVVRSAINKSLRKNPPNEDYRWIALQMDCMGHTTYMVFGRLIGEADWIKNIKEVDWT